jgi:hypothetical protein
MARQEAAERGSLVVERERDADDPFGRGEVSA